MSKIFDCIIIGGGPSGLAVGSMLAQASDIDFIIIDNGDYLQKPDGLTTLGRIIYY